MRDAIAGQRQTLKSKLLIGAVGFAAASVGNAAFAADDAAQAPATPPPAPNTWSAYASAGGGLGDGYAQGRVDIFVPAWQNLDSLAFFNIGIGTATRQDVFSNANLGYRTKVSPDWILGGYVGFDTSKTTHGDHTFNQFTAGAEAMSADWDARINAYLANSGIKGNGQYQLAIQNTSISILQSQEAAFSGFDGEVGYRVFNTDDTDLRVFVGGFSFTHHHDFHYQDISGPMARAELNVFDIDALGPQSRITVEGEISHDDVRGTDGFVGATLRIPLGDISGAGAQALDDLDRRMTDPVRRRGNVLTQSEFNKPEPVIIYGKHVRSQPTNTLYYVDNSTGSGSYADPTTLPDATGRGAGNNAFIVATDFEGVVKTGGATLRQNETLVGGGQTFTVKGVNSGVTFTHAFAPGSGTPSLTGGSAKTNALNLSSDTSVYGLDFVGPFNDAIFGANVSNVTIGNIAINGSAGGDNGIVIRQNRSQNVSVSISDAAISHLSGDGIDIRSGIKDGGTSTQSISIDHTTITHVGGYGIDVSTNVTGGSTSFTQNVKLTDVTAKAGGPSGVLFTGNASSGAALKQILSIDPTTISGSYYGLQVSADATAGAHLNQSVDISDVTASGALSAIYVYGSAGSNGALHQSVSLDHVDAADAIVGVSLIGVAHNHGKVFQNFDIHDLSAHDNLIDGLTIYGLAAEAGRGSALLAQYITVENSSFTDNGGLGGDIYLVADGPGAAGLQQIEVSNSAFSGNLVGLGLGETAINSAAAQQNALLTNDSLTDNFYVGGAFFSTAMTQGFASQSVAVYGSPDHAFDITGNGSDGIWLRSRAYYGGNVEQNAKIYYANISHNGGDGVYVDTLASGYTKGAYTYYYSQITSYVVGAFASLNHNAGSGVRIDNLVEAGGQLNQFAELYGVTLNSNAAYGALEHSVDSGYLYPGSSYGLTTQLYSDLYVVNASASHNGLSGLGVQAEGYGPAYMIQHLTIEGVNATRNTGDGITLISGSYGPAFVYQAITLNGVHADSNKGNGLSEISVGAGPLTENLQEVTIANSTFDNNHHSGAYFYGADYYGPGPFGATFQYVTIRNSDFSGNRVSGLRAVADASGSQGRVTQNFTIDYSTFDHNKINGLDIYLHSHDGVYVPPTTVGSTTYGGQCYLVQGLYGQCSIIRQIVQILGSDFSYNGRDGLYLHSVTDDFGSTYTMSGRPNAPTLLIVGSSFDHNGYDGLQIKNYVSQFSYLQQFAYAFGSSFDHNGNDGVQLSNVLDYGIVNTAALSTVTPYQLGIVYSDVSHNGADGLDIENTTIAESALIQGVYLSDSHFDDNHDYGIISNSTNGNGSLLLQRTVLYSYLTGMSADGNGADGVQVAITGGSQAIYAASAVYVYSANGAPAGDFSNNGASGISILAADGAHNNSYIYNANVDHNAIAGISLSSFDYAEQFAYIGLNTISNNPVGVLAYESNALQIVSVYNNYYTHAPMGNVFSGNSTDVAASGAGGVQIIY